MVALPPLRPNEEATCPRCQHTLVKRHYRPVQRSFALAISAFIALLHAVFFPFVSFQVSGFNNNIELSETATTLLGFDQPVIAILVALTIIVLPAIYLLNVIWLQFGLLRARPLPFSRDIARSLKHLHPWMMADVFIVGTLVSLVKISGSAEIALEVGFWAFCSFVLLLLFTMRSIDDDWMWFSLAGEPLAPEGTRLGETATSQGVVGCPTCGVITRLGEQARSHCQRCGEVLHARTPHSLQRTWALLFAAAVLYIPANIYPIMQNTAFGQSHASTIIGGIMDLISGGSWPIALIIFIASIIVPIVKIVVLAWLCLRINHSSTMTDISRIRLYRLTDFIGRWSMVDVFVVAILVALIRAGELMSISPGPAALAFASVVVLTMLAAISFDPRLIWDSPECSQKNSAKDYLHE